MATEDLRTAVNRYIINETAASILGWDDPVGKKLDLSLSRFIYC